MQEIRLEQVLPQFFEKGKTAPSDIWLQDISFRKGLNIQVVAPSGSGKTSLVHFLYRMRSDYTGKIFFDTKDSSSLDPDALARLRTNELSVVFQDLRLFPAQSMRENIRVKRDLAPFIGAASMEEMAAMLGIAHKLEQSAGTCSYGEQQRIAIIRALQQPFDFLLLDEPFSHLDDNNIEKAMKLILNESAKRKACVLLADLQVNNSFPADQTLKLA